MPKLISAAKLSQHKANGAKVITPTSDALVETLKMNHRTYREQMDIVIGKLKDLVDKKPEENNINEIVNQLAIIHKKPTYNFKVTRDGRGLITTIEATPSSS